MSDHGTGANHRPTPNGKAGECGAACSQRATFLQDGQQRLSQAFPASRPVIVREHCARPDEDVIPDGQAVPEKDAAFDRHPVAHANFSLDERVIANIAIFSNNRPAHNVGKRPHPRSPADRNPFINERLRMREVVLRRAIAGGAGRRRARSRRPQRLFGPGLQDGFQLRVIPRRNLVKIVRAAARAKTLLPIEQAVIQSVAFILARDAEIKESLFLVSLDERGEQVRLRASLASLFRYRAVL